MPKLDQFRLVKAFELKVQAFSMGRAIENSTGLFDALVASLVAPWLLWATCCTQDPLFAEMLSGLDCESKLSNDTLISLIQHLESEGNPLPERALQDLVRALSNEPALEESVLEQLHPLLRRVLVDQVQRVTDREKAVEWIRAKIQKLKVDQGVREETAGKTTAVYRRPKFVDVQGRHYRIPKELLGLSADWEVNLNYDFEVMDIPVTQALWSLTMGGAPLHSKGLYLEDGDLIESVVNGLSERIAPNHPVHGVGAFLAMEYANRLSIANGLRPAYFLSSLKSTAPWNGVALGSAQLTERSLDDAEGYRLPSEIEWAIMASSFYSRCVGLNDNDQINESLRRGWFEQNADALIREVALKEPCAVGDGSVYDLMGLVKEFTHHIMPVVRNTLPHSVTQPTVDDFGNMFFIQIRSLSALDPAGSQPYRRVDLVRDTMPINENSKPGVGFRLVRTIRKHSREAGP